MTTWDGRDYRVHRHPDGSITAAADPGSGFGRAVQRLAEVWHDRQTVGQHYRIPADRAAEWREMTEQRLTHALYRTLADNRLVPLSAPRPFWVWYPGRAMEPTPPVETVRELAEMGGRFVPGDGRRVFEPGDMAVCLVELLAVPDTDPDDR